MNEDLPNYVVMHAKSKHAEQSLFSRLWGTGFMPSDHQGILLRSQGDPVLYLTNPKGTSTRTEELNWMPFPFSTGSTTKPLAIPRCWPGCVSMKWLTACKPRFPS